MVYPPVIQFETRALALAEPLRVVVFEDSVLLRAGTARLLEKAGFDVVAQACDRDDLVRKVRAHRPDVALLPPDPEVARRLLDALPRLGLLVLAGRDQAGQARDVLAGRTEGIGYLLKDRLGEDRLADAVTRVARGASVLDPEVVSTMVRARRGDLDELTVRERDVLDAMAAGKSNRGIAETLYVSERAVERHISAIFAKLGIPTGDHAHRRVLAVLRAVAA